MIELARALAEGELEVLGRLPDASNLALLCEVVVAGQRQRCIYKPVAGERPLWDFPGAALAAREVLAAVVSHSLGWHLVPETAWREDGPAGPGMCQEWIDHAGGLLAGLYRPEAVPDGWMAVAEGRSGDGSLVVLAHAPGPDLQRLVVLDDLLNNADRKGGHLLRRDDGRLAAIDHGVTFHAEPKLRTVLWGWAGQPLPAWLAEEVAGGREPFIAALSTRVARLSRAEVRAAVGRLDRVLEEGTFPMPGDSWPSLPWPPM